MTGWTDGLRHRTLVLGQHDRRFGRTRSEKSFREQQPVIRWERAFAPMALTRKGHSVARTRFSVRELLFATAFVAVCFAVLGVVIGGIVSAIVLLHRWLDLRKRSLVTLSLILVSVLLVLSSKQAIWVGHMNVELRFSVVDRRSGRPIQGAVIEFFEVDCLPEMKLKPLRTITTDGDGTARLVESQVFTGRDRWPWGREESVRMPYWEYRVSAAGFGSQGGATLYQLLGAARDTAHPNPPPIRFGLSPVPTPSDSRGR